MIGRNNCRQGEEIVDAGQALSQTEVEAFSEAQTKAFFGGGEAFSLDHFLQWQWRLKELLDRDPSTWNLYSDTPEPKDSDMASEKYSDEYFDEFYNRYAK